MFTEDLLKELSHHMAISGELVAGPANFNNYSDVVSVCELCRDTRPQKFVAKRWAFYNETHFHGCFLNICPHCEILLRD